MTSMVLRVLAAGQGLWPGGALVLPALLAHSGGERWGWGLVTFALQSGLPPALLPGRIAASTFLTSSGHHASSWARRQPLSLQEAQGALREQQVIH